MRQKIFWEKIMLLRKSAADLMTEEIATVDESALVSDIAQLMAKKNIGAVVVTNSIKDPVGIFTERDLLKRVIGEGLDPKSTKIAKVMTPKFVCAQADDDAEELVELMINGNFRHLPVVSGSKFLGILSMRDLAKHLAGMP
jgi:CBS domain-containing protein